jgi:predicted ferric reductase
MNEHSWWYLSRASGLIAWVVLAVTCMWGILLITRMLKPADRPAWLLDLHKYLGVLSILTTLAHMVALVGDNWMYFGWRELFVPGAFSNAYQPELHTAVLWGVIAFYLMVIIQVTSWAMKLLPKKLWHTIHLTSYALFVMCTIHGLQAGSDVDNMVLLLTMSGIIGIVLFALVARILQGRAKKIQRAEANALRSA